MMLAMRWTDRAIRFGKRIFKEVGEDDLSGAAGELAYRFFLALFPFFIFLAAMGGFVADLLGVRNPTQEIMKLLGDSLPPDAASVLREQLESVVETRNAQLLSLGIVGAIWSASSGVSTIAKCMNRIYEVKETRPMWRRFLMNIGLTILGGAFSIGCLILLFVGQVAGTEAAADIGLEDQAAMAINLARWPAIFLMLLIATAFLYWAAPNVKLPFRLFTPGALVFIVGWLVMSYFFGLYVSNFGSYNATYGALGGIVVLLVWFYLTSFLLVLGVEINAVLAEGETPEQLPQTPAEGATTGTAAQSRDDEVVGNSGSRVTSVSKPRMPEPPRLLRHAPALVDPPAEPRIVTALALFVAAVTYWRVASGLINQSIVEGKHVGE
jgi:membrane protein